MDRVILPLTSCLPRYSFKSFRSVEAIGIDRVCHRIPPLPTPLHSHFAGRLRDRIIVCGGNDGLYERYSHRDRMIDVIASTDGASAR